MNILSRRERLLNRTSRGPKMSTRRQFHRALRRHPAWPLVIAEASARARAQDSIRRSSAGVTEMGTVSHRKRLRRILNRDRTNVMTMGQASSRTELRRALRRYRTFIVTLLAVGALVALLTGLAMAEGEWVSGEVNDPTNPPPAARFGAATTFDMTNSETFIFGGFNAAPGGTPVARNDSWGHKSVGSWGHNSKWINRNSVHRPSPRGYASMTYDAARKNVVLFGGAPYRSNTVSGETWIWDGKDWILLDPPEPRPAARQNASTVYDAHRKLVVMFGGRGADGLPLDDTWTWNGSTWKKMITEGGPSSRHSAAMAYDVCRGEAVMFGGRGRVGTAPLDTVALTSVAGETWTWNGTKWTKKQPLVSPPARVGASMTYSYLRGRVLLYGGFTSTDNNQAPVASDYDVWKWNGTAWEKYASETSPIVTGLALFGPYVTGSQAPPRAYASFEFYPDGNIIHIFGGTPADPTNTPPVGIQNLIPQVALGDRWYFNERGGQAADLLPNRCDNPVPIPADGTSSGGEAIVSPPKKVETRDEIREIARLPVLLGTDPKTVPAGTPKPPCMRRPGSEHVGNTYLATDPKRNRVYQFFICEPPQFGQTGTRKVLIQAYDGTTLKPLGSVLAPITSSFAFIETSSKHGADLLHDVERGRFLLPLGSDLWVIQQDLIEKGVDPVTKITIAGGTYSTFFNHPKTGRPKLLTFSGSAVSQLDLGDDRASNRQDWTVAVDGCSNFTKGMRIEDRVYTSCLRSQNQQAVVRIPVIEAANGSETSGTAEVFPGPYNVSTTWGDPQAERLLLESDTDRGASLWVFDGKVSRYVGRSGLTGDNPGNSTPPGWGTGFDQETGRFYMLARDHFKRTTAGAPKIQGGVRVVDTRLTPVPQAINFGQFSYPSSVDTANLPPRDGLPRRVFVRRAQGGTPSDPNDPNQVDATDNDSFAERYPDGELIYLPDEMYYLVLADTLPVPEQLQLTELDSLTIPVAESAGKTSVSFDAEGSGYGIRLRSVGGLMSALQPPAQTGFAITTETRNVPSCFFPDRELLAGWVAQTHLSDLETSALSSGLEVDSSSKVDLEVPFSRCQVPLVGAETLPPTARPVFNTLWPLVPFATLDSTVGQQLVWNKHFQKVECSGDSGAIHKATLGDIYGSATCKQKEARVEGMARGALGSGSSEAFSVGEGYSNVVVKREAERGVVVTSTAVATGIKLPGISIGYVKMEAVSWSNGRPSDKPRASFTRTICRVNPAPNDNPNACLTPQQQQDMARDFNARMGVNGKMTLPAPDSDFLKGSSGGYIGGVTKPLAEEVEDQIFTSEIQKEVPSLQIVFYKDNPVYGPGRQVLQLAAVRAITGFGVQCESDFIYSPSAKNCVALALEDAFLAETEDESLNEEGLSSLDGTEFDSGGGWMPEPTVGSSDGLALGRRLGQFIQNLPFVRLLPLRQIGEAFLAGAVWYLLGLPLFFASRRFALNLARRS